jgi:osmotically-inducible protein OsmY
LTLEPATAALDIEVKTTLISSEAIDAAAILIELTGDTLVLSGFVDSPEEASEAARLATLAADGIPVANRLKVR